jgi:hypothetical protein
MSGVLGGDVDDVDIGAGDQFLVRAVRAWDAVAVGKGLCAGGVPGGDCGEPLPGMPLGGTDEAFGDPAGAEDALAQGGASIGSGVRGSGLTVTLLWDRPDSGCVTSSSRVCPRLVGRPRS